MVRKRRTRGHVIADLSVNHIERFALLCGYSVERVQHDYGIDLMLLTYDTAGEAENGSLYVQLKATDALNMRQDGETISFVAHRSDLDLWLHEPMPYILVVYDAQADVGYWLYVQAYFERLPGFNLDMIGTTTTIYIPTVNILDEARRLGDSPNSRTWF